MSSGKMIQFPKGFLWGAATSAHQVEGNNQKNDWWEWEKKVGLKDASGNACRHYEFYKDDFDLARQLNHNAHRLSIEWSRIEPEEGNFSTAEIAHYIDVIDALKQRNIEPIVTLHHFTNPLWFAKLGGWQNKKAPEYFLRFTNKIVGVLSDKVRFWVTINEPMVYVYHSYVLGQWPPQCKYLFKSQEVVDNLLLAHIKSYRAIHSIYKKVHLPAPCVSIAKNMQPFMPCIPNLKNKIGTYLRNKFFNLAFLKKLIRSRTLDFIGINYYTRGLIEVKRWGLENLFLDVCSKNHSSLRKNSLGWDIYPQGLYLILMQLKKYNLPVFILENGICTADDNLRWEFICEHLKNLNLAMQKGVKVLGYTYWSLLDNFEWAQGFTPRFGLIEVNYNNYQRTIRESARKYSLICEKGAL
ncbi:MAG: glycoside hydrolase family 1 protein [Candidatus Omnitrophica bacterium]|nr:glycoside hydrolase family 1 protein [Candidatus Omnitrophota bacterium]